MGTISGSASPSGAADSASKDKELSILDKAVGAITAVLGAVTALLGAFGAGSPGSLVERIVRNEPALSASGFLSIGLSLAMAVLALAASGSRLLPRQRFRPALLAALVLWPLILLVVTAAIWKTSYIHWFGIAAVLLVGYGIPLSLGLRSPIPETNPESRWLDIELVFERLTLYFSAFILVVGLLLLTIPVLVVYAAKQTPYIDAKLKTAAGRILEVTVKARGVAVGDLVQVRVDRLRYIEAERKWKETPEGQSLYRTTVGPDPNGTVDLSLELPLPVGDYSTIGVQAKIGITRWSCDLEQRGPEAYLTPGCALIRVPEEPLRPQLFTSWDASTTANTVLVISVKAQDVQPKQAVLLQVRGMWKNPSRSSKLLYSSLVTPNSAGLVNAESIKIPVTANYPEVCVTAHLTAVPSLEGSRNPSDTGACPPTNTYDGAWSELRFPEHSDKQENTKVSEVPRRVEIEWSKR